MFSATVFTKDQLVNHKRRYLLLSKGTKIPLGSFKGWQDSTDDAFGKMLLNAAKTRNAYESNIGMVVGDWIGVDWDRLHDKPYRNDRGQEVPAESADKYIDGVVFREKLMREHGEYHTRTWKSRNGGVVDIFLADHRTARLKNGAQQIARDGKIVKVDLKVRKQYLVCPPSKVPVDNSIGTGTYEWISEVEPVSLPDWLFEILFSGYNICGREEIIELSIGVPGIPNGKLQDPERYVRAGKWVAENLADKYADSRDNWVAFAYYCARCINGGCDVDSMFDIFHEFSGGSPKYDADETEALLESFIGKPAYAGIPTLRKWANEMGMLGGFEASLRGPEEIVVAEEEIKYFDQIHLMGVLQKRPLSEAFCQRWMPKVCVVTRMPKLFYFRTSKGWTRLTSGQIATDYSQDFFWVDGRPMPFAAFVFKYGDSKQCTTLEPIYDPVTEFNPYGGFPYRYTPNVPEDHPDMARIRRHIWEVVSMRNIETYNYLVAWMGRVLLGEKTETILVFKGMQGSGKSMIWNDLMLKVLMGPNYSFSFRTLNDVAGRFNSHLEGKYYAMADDLPDYDKANEGLFCGLKILATSKQNLSEGKGKAAESVKNTINLVMLTNCEQPIRIEADDRRYVCLRTSAEYVGQKHYNDPLGREVNNLEYASLWASYCIDQYRARGCELPAISPSDWKVKLRIASCPVLTYLHDRCEAFSGTTLVEKLSTEALYNDYRSQDRMSETARSVTRIAFGRIAKGYLPECRVPGNNGYVQGVEMNLEELFSAVRAKLQ